MKKTTRREVRFDAMTLSAAEYYRQRIVSIPVRAEIIG